MVDLLGYIAGILGMVSFIPQLVKTIKTKKCDDISIGMLWLFIVTNLFYIAYGTLLLLWPVIITISIMTVIIMAQILLTLKYRKTKIILAD